jgi:hypothetical protein
MAAVATSVSAAMTQQRTELTEDTARLTRQLLADRGLARIAYPVLGATYTLHWTMVRMRSAAARP